MHPKTAKSVEDSRTPPGLFGNLFSKSPHPFRIFRPGTMAKAAKQIVGRAIKSTRTALPWPEETRRVLTKIRKGCGDFDQFIEGLVNFFAKN